MFYGMFINYVPSEGERVSWRQYKESTSLKSKESRYESINALKLIINCLIQLERPKNTKTLICLFCVFGDVKVYLHVLKVL